MANNKNKAKQPSMAARILKDGRQYAELNRKLGIKTLEGPSKDARPMTRQEKEQYGLTMNQSHNTNK